MTDRITEHYQENPEGARLVSDDELRSGQTMGSVSSRKKPENSAGADKVGKAGKADKAAKVGKSDKVSKVSKSIKSSKSAKSGKAVKPAESSGAKGGAEKKTAAPKKKTAEKPEKPENPAKKSAGITTEPDESGEQSQSVKTPSVMRLVEERAFSENQVVAAGKSLIPRQLRGIEPLSKVMRREAELSESANSAQPTEPDDEVSRSPMVMRELTGMVIAECVPGILKRFNACDCEKCMSELARLTAEEIPARYMKIPELADLSWNGFSDDERLLIDSLKKNAVTVMIRLMIANKKRNFHC